MFKSLRTLDTMIEYIVELSLYPINIHKLCVNIEFTAGDFQQRLQVKGVE